MEMVLDQVCASCGSKRLPYGRFCLNCGDLLADPGAAASTPSIASMPGAMPAAEPEIGNYAGFWLRVWAGAIDVTLEVAGALLLTLGLDFILKRFGSLVGVTRWTSAFASGMAFILLLSVGAWLYCAFTESSPWRATVGKRMLGLQVVTLDGQQLSFGQATVRHFMKFLSLFGLMIGFMMAGWTQRRQALHDMPVDCTVVRVAAKGFSLLGS
jgi:uncharacterized RDD family membrane protein YckC